MAFSATTNKKINAVSSSEHPLLLLEISHSDLAAPVRVVQDNADITFESNAYTAMGFDASLPDDIANKLPRARLTVDNVGKELVQWLEASAGGQGASCRLIQIMRSDPAVIEWEITMDLSNLSIDMLSVNGELSFDDLLNKPGVTKVYRPSVAPGLF
jgi:hypothetical protein